MKSCLIVDDSRVVRKVIRRIVENLELACAEAENGQDALEHCASNMPDVILLDWNMPVMSGIEFIEQLRKTENGAHPKVIFCTTENDMEHIQRAMALGADEYIMKPFDGDIVETKLKQVGVL